VTIAIVTASLAVLAVLGGVALLVYRTRQDRPGAVFTARPVPPAPPDRRPALSSGHKQAIEPPREVHLHLNVSPDQLAAILRHHLEEE
jgi:hypothetical protein